MGEPEAKRARSAPVMEPEGLKCPITLALLRDPVSTCVGNTYERIAIVAHLAKPGAKRDPLTNEALANRKLIPNQSLRRLVQDFLDAHPDYTPEGWDSRLVPPLPGVVQATLAEVEAAQAANSVPRLLAALVALPNAVEVQAAGFEALFAIIDSGDDEIKKQARESEVYGLVLAAMRNYRSHVELQTMACLLLPQLYCDNLFSAKGLATGAHLVELVLATATAHAGDAECADAVCNALAFMLEHGEWACAVGEKGGAKAVLSLMSAHSDPELLQSDGIDALSSMVKHAEWASVQAEAGNILAAAVRGLSAAHVAGSFLHAKSLDMLSLLIRKDASIAAQVIAADAFDLAIKAMRSDLNYDHVQMKGFHLLKQLAKSQSSAALPRLQLYGASEAIAHAMDAHSSNGKLQRHGCLALQALQHLIRLHMRAVVVAAHAAHPEEVDDDCFADTIAAVDPSGADDE